MATASATHRPAVSVVIPLFNGAATIFETLTSIQRQTLPVLEVIVVDDGSSDGGARIARDHPLAPTVITQANGGVAVARNHGLSLAQGTWVAFLDQDDLWHPTHIERCTGLLQERPGVGILFVREVPFTVDDERRELTRMDALAGGWAHMVAPRMRTLDHLVANADVTGTGNEVRHDVHAVLRGPISVTTSFVADPQVLRLAGGFAPHALAMDDYWLLVNIARHRDIVQVDQPTVFYRVHVNATSRTTKLGLPFLSSAVALRMGGGIVGRDEGLAPGPTGGIHEHLLDELMRSPEYGDARFRRAVDALARLLWPDTRRWWSRGKARLAAKAPWLSAASRRWRRRVRGV